jgi:hypothetical protein
LLKKLKLLVELGSGESERVEVFHGFSRELNPIPEVGAARYVFRENELRDVLCVDTFVDGLVAGDVGFFRLVGTAAWIAKIAFILKR